MPWIYAPFFVMVRKKKEGAWTKSEMEIIEAFGGDQDYVLQKFNDRRRSLEAQYPGCDYLYLRAVKGAKSRPSKWDYCHHPYEIELTAEGKLHFWCYPYDPTCKIGKIEGDIPDEVLADLAQLPLGITQAADAAERYIQTQAQKAVEEAKKEGGNVRDKGLLAQLFFELQRRR